MQGFGDRVVKAYGSLGCRVSDLGFVKTHGSLGCRVSEIGLLKHMGVWGAGFRIQGFLNLWEFGVQGFGDRGF